MPRIFAARLVAARAGEYASGVTAFNLGERKISSIICVVSAVAGALR
jgi:hypothetical protein